MGGSGGGGSYYGDVSASDLQKRMQDSTAEMARGYAGELQGLLDGVLADWNVRDTDLINEHREKIKTLLDDRLDLAVDIPFGGSVSKSTYINGISDVDALLVLKDLETKDISPGEVKATVAALLKDRLGDATVTEGNMAVTVTYNDGLELQLIPAIRAGDQLKVPSWTGKRWSEIDPDKFQTALTKCNDKCNSKLVPMIKLAKGVISSLPEAHQLSGYHVEALAIDAFKRYEGDKTTAHMLPRFFEKASKAVLSPIKDSTGQSVNVDSYLGAAKSAERKQASHLFERLAKRMRNASAAASQTQWMELLGGES